MAFEDVYGRIKTTTHLAGYYDSVNEKYVPAMRALLPDGLAWRFDNDSDMTPLLVGLSYSFARVAERALDLLEEVEPRTTFELLDDWERVFGLPGDNPSPPTSLAARRAAVHAKLLGHGDPTPAFFEAVAASIGYTAKVTHNEYDPFVAGSPVGDRLTNGGWAFAWTITTIRGPDDDLLEWMIKSLTPEHTRVVFVYS